MGESETHKKQKKDDKEQLSSIAFLLPAFGMGLLIASEIMR